MTPRVCIIGAGLGGLGLGVKLKRAGVESFTIFEKSDGPGGTWWDNTYPGACSDVGASLYSYSFMSYDWTRTHPSRDELLDYIQAVIERFDLSEHIRYGTGVREVVWNDHLNRYAVHTESGDIEEFEVVVSAVGMLNVPHYPDWPGLEDFTGPKFHTARWEHEHDLRGRRVAVVGTGSTAVQVVSGIAPIVERLYVFQREPGWIVPKVEREYTSDERARMRRWPALRRYDRAKLYLSFERLRSAAEPTSKAQAALRDLCLRHIAESIDDSELRSTVTPDHPVWCKRPVLSKEFYQSLNRENVELVPHAVARVTEGGLVDAVGVEREIDVLIMATGFGAADYLSTFEIKGRGGRDLHETWAGEPSAFLGLGLPEFPNFYMMYGPGTNGGSIIFKLERQAEWIVRVIERMRRGGLSTVEIRPEAHRRFTSWLDRANTKMAWHHGCHNYFSSPSGRIVTQWPASSTLYWLMTRTLNRIATKSKRADTTRQPDRAPVTHGT